MSVVSITREGEIAVATIDNPPVNVLSQAVRQGLWDAVSSLDADPQVRAVVLVCAGRTFIAGADVTEFGKPPTAPHLPDLVDRIEGAQKPWVAAIHGSALGGGFEVAMGCRFRVAVEGASVGLPEVSLGIVPGASGTVRTPRLAGVEAAVELVTSGKPVKAAKALSLGLVDAVFADDLQANALAFARDALTRDLPPPVSVRLVTAPDPGFWDEKRKAVAKAAKGADAPLRALVDELNAEGELDAVEPGAPEAAEELAEAYVEAEAAKAISPPMGPNDSQSPEQPRHSSHNASPHDAAQDRDASTSPSSRIVPGHPDHRHPGYEALIADKQYRREEEETKAMLEPDSPYPTV